MAYFQGLGQGPVNYFSSMVPDFRSDALKETQNQMAQAQVTGLNMQNQQVREQYQQQQRTQQAFQQYQQQFGTALANNDRNAMKQLHARYPQFFERTQKGLGLVDADRNKVIGDAAMDLRLASQQGPEAMQAALQKNAPALGYIGTSPEVVYQSWVQDPARFEKTADLLHLHAVGPDEYFKVRDQQEGRSIDRGRLAETARNNDMTNARGWAGLNQQARYQNAQIEQGQQRLGIDAQKSAFDQQGRQDKMIADRQAAVSSYDSQAGNIANMMTTLSQIMGNDKNNTDANIKPEVFDQIFGFGGTIRAHIPGTEAADAWGKVKQMQAQARLMGVIGMKGTGPVSDPEGQAAAQAFLSLDQNMSPKAAKSAINNWNRTLQRQATYLRTQKSTIERYRQQINATSAPSEGPQQIQEGHSEGGYTYLGGDPGDQNNWRKN